MSSKNGFLAAFAFVWRGLDRLRRILHFAFLITVLAIIVAVLVPQRVVVPDSAALVIAPTGAIVDQLSGDPVDRALAELQGNGRRETRLRDLIDAIRYAKDDDRIKAIYLNLDEMANVGLSKLQAIAKEIDAFRETGKRVVAAGDNFSRDQYYLAATADEIYMHPMGIVLIDGYGRFVTYYKSALDALYVDYHVWTAGEYKSFTEPFTRDDMSPEDREASAEYLRVLWDQYQSDILVRRSLDDGALQRFAEQYTELLDAAGGNSAAMALEYGLLDGLRKDNEVNELLRATVGPSPDVPDRFAAIDMPRYLQSVREDAGPQAGGDRVAVITLSGTIYDGVEPPGSIGGDSAARMIRDAARDDQIKALVLRVDSPGGSAFASDLILDELKSFQDSGRPMVVSMGSVAASGGYWISMSADEIWASATTITGSIGVGAMLPTIPRTLDRVGVHVDGIGTTSLAGQFSIARELGDDADTLFRQTVAYLYSHFIGQVAEFRNQSREQVDAVARGRVWTGSHAHQFGLVDRLGNLDDAIESAANLAGLAAGSFEIDFIEHDLDLAESIAMQIAGVSAPFLRLLKIDPPWADQVARFLAAAGEPVQFLNRHNDPRGVYSLCFCDMR